jgi:hypothetical protein
VSERGRIQAGVRVHKSERRTGRKGPCHRHWQPAAKVRITPAGGLRNMNAIRALWRHMTDRIGLGLQIEIAFDGECLARRGPGWRERPIDSHSLGPRSGASHSEKPITRQRA